MPIYMQATIEPVMGMRNKLIDLLREKIVPHQEQQGWKLVGCYTTRTGLLDNIIDLWEMDDMAHFERGIAALGKHPEGAALFEELNRYRKSETLVFLNRHM